MPRSTRTVLVLSLALILCSASARARSNAGLTYTGASHYSGFELEGAADLDAEAKWEGNLSYEHTNSTIGGTASTTNQFSIGGANVVNDSNDWRATLSLWNDSVNQIHYVGPSAGYTHNWLSDEKEPSELWGLTLDADLNFYGADVTTTAGGRTVRRGAPTATKNATVRTTQFHPSLMLEKPFLDERLVPYVTAGHYFYSNDPANLEAAMNRVGVHLTPKSLSGVDSMVGGFVRNSWAAGTRLAITHATSLRLEAGREQLATDSSWATVYSVKGSQTLGDHVKIGLGWSHSVEDAVPVDYAIGSFTYLF